MSGNWWEADLKHVQERFEGQREHLAPARHPVPREQLRVADRKVVGLGRLLQCRPSMQDFQHLRVDTAGRVQGVRLFSDLTVALGELG